ncbi:MAG: hypothetical protein Q9219_003564 [cf. Caloplaca sp. 3 TL-2023]
MFYTTFALLSLGATLLAQASAVPGHQNARRQSGPVPPDTVKDCTYFYDSQPGDTCASIADTWGITQIQFKTYNPSVKSDCSSLVIGTAYCVEENYGNGPVPPETTSSTSKTTSKTSSTATSPAPTGPSPVQSGITTECKQYYKVQDGDTCAGIVDKYHTSTLQNFYSWNPAVGDSKTFYKVKEGDECGSIVSSYGTFSLADFTPSTRSSITITSTTSTPSISPTQTGIVSSCKLTLQSILNALTSSPGTRYYKAVDGDSCDIISTKFGTFTTSQFISWNPAVQSDCSRLFLGYYYCIAVPGTPTTRSTSSTTKTTLTSSSGPTPTQSGIISSCTKYYKAVSGDTCQVISDKYGTFTVSQFISWNPAVKSDCSQLFLNYYYCVGVPGTPTSRSATTSTSKTTSKTPTPTANGPQPQQPGIVSNCAVDFGCKLPEVEYRDQG